MDEISLHGLYQEQNPFEFATSVQFEMSITACNCTHATQTQSTVNIIHKFKSKNRSCRPVINLLMLNVILPVLWRFEFVFVLMCVFRCLALWPIHLYCICVCVCFECLVLELVFLSWWWWCVCVYFQKWPQAASWAARFIFVNYFIETFSRC